jgi:hypothetical protein
MLLEHRLQLGHLFLSLKEVQLGLLGCHKHALSTEIVQQALSLLASLDGERVICINALEIYALGCQTVSCLCLRAGIAFKSGRIYMS